MSDQINLVFKGQLESGWQKTDVAANLAKLLKVSDDKALNLFNKETIIKRNVSFPEVKKYVSAFKRAGATLEVVASEVVAEKPSDQPVAESTPSDSSLTLCPQGTPVLEESERAGEVVYEGAILDVEVADVGADIGDPKDPVAPLTFDFSGIEVEEIEDVPPPTLEPKG